MFDSDTQEAIKAKWDAATISDEDAAAMFLDLDTPVTLADIVIGGLHEEPINVEGNLRLEQPYAGFDVKPDGRTNQYSAGGGEIDFRRVRVTIYANVRELVGKIMRVVDKAFDEQPLTIANAEWMRTEAVMGNHGRLEKADKANADSFWKGTLEYTVWISRQKAAMTS